MSYLVPNFFGAKQLFHLLHLPHLPHLPYLPISPIHLEALELIQVASYKPRRSIVGFVFTAASTTVTHLRCVLAYQ